MMNIKRFVTLPILCTLAIITITGCSKNNGVNVYQQVSEYNFEETLLNLDIAISEYNYRIIHRSQIGQAIRDRGEKNFPLSTITNFCNITYAKEMMEINSDLINEMPCTIAVREETVQGIIVSTRLMNEHTANEKQNQFAVKINNNLKSIIAATVE
ncbi:hypothetical protein LCGC14_1305930 [marine sediment metagenome]|uniref:DUF302 domain-containing protein n=1 Tax=marine sediment metagenome TaxID=412755 RepID=A0A0F9L8Q3_9ZZZZ|nr:DUF302 domain-containing protein [Methylophaga sp.]HEC59485.1 DUF302 domain-containing protein [Methylophaga sp.]